MDLSNFVLNNGLKIPSIGFGTWELPEGEKTACAVKNAISVGYKHIDTAAAYENERSIAEGIRQSGVRREDVFVTSKVWLTSMGYEKTLLSFKETLSELDTDYLDLLLIHVPAVESMVEQWQRLNLSTWKAMEHLYKEGYVKAIGVSNFRTHHMTPLLEEAEITPMVNQIEFHPGMMQSEAVNLCKEHNILVEAWSPLGNGKLLQAEQLVRMAEKYNKTTAQLCIRWCLQHGVLPLPKSLSPAHLADNRNVFDFEISDEDMKTIDLLPPIAECFGIWMSLVNCFIWQENFICNNWQL